MQQALPNLTWTLMISYTAWVELVFSAMGSQMKKRRKRQLPMAMQELETLDPIYLQLVDLLKIYSQQSKIQICRSYKASSILIWRNLELDPSQESLIVTQPHALPSSTSVKRPMRNAERRSFKARKNPPDWQVQKTKLAKKSSSECNQLSPRMPARFLSL